MATPNEPNPRLPNPLLKSEKRDDNAKLAADIAKPVKATKETVIRLWGGGEHKKALELFRSLKLSSDDQNEVRDACPGWNELAEQS